MKINTSKDGHMHSEFCPHGTNDKMELYIKEGISKGLYEMSFTEHMPMIDGFYKDKEFLKECAPDIKNIEKYFKEVVRLKEKYKNDIKINIGLEVDYIEDYEKSTEELLRKYIGLMDDGILSVHFLKYNDKYYPIDIIENFEELLRECGSLEKIYNLYFETVIKSMKSGIGKGTLKRIGHPTLIRIFNKKYPIKYENIKLITEMVDTMKEEGYQCDINTAGLRKEFCGEIYPYIEVLKLIIDNKIECVLGSDSHESKDVGFGIDYINNLIEKI